MKIWIMSGAMCAASALLTLPALAAAPADEQPVKFNVSGFAIQGENPLSNPRTLKVLAPFLGPQEGIDGVRKAADALQAALANAGYSFYRVVVPPQTLKDGEVVLEVKPFVLGTVTVTGNQFYSEANIRRSLPALIEGKSPDARAITRALGVANMIPTKREAVTFARSREPGKVDAEITVRDRDPRQAYVWLNNTGNEDTGDTRLGIGLQHHNLFDRDHVLTLTYTTAPEETDKVSQYGLNYEIPLYGLGGRFSGYAVYSDVDTGTVGDFFNVSGSGEFYGLRYAHILPKWGELRQRLIFDLADKLFDNEAEFSGVPVGVDVKSRPLSLQYLTEWDARRTSGHFLLGYYRNLDGGEFNDEDSYAASRVGADPEWSAWRAGASLRLPLAGQWLISALLDAQYANEPLIPGEQFGVGGLASVRGFEEREITGDRGVMGRLELWSPPFGERFRAGVFLDGGYVARLEPQAGERQNVAVASAGIGANWDWRTNLSAQLYYAYVLEGLDDTLPGETADGDSKVHFSIIYRFF